MYEIPDSIFWEVCFKVSSTENLLSMQKVKSKSTSQSYCRGQTKALLHVLLLLLS